jgi:hypothetical protein
VNSSKVEISSVGANGGDFDISTHDVTDPLNAWWEAGFVPDDHAAWPDAARYTLATDDWETDDQTCLREALRWCVSGFSPVEVRAWRDGLVEFEETEYLAQEARRWREVGFTPHEAWLWTADIRGSSEKIEFSILFRDRDWHPYGVGMLYALYANDEAKDWVETCRAWATMPAHHAVDCARAGLSPQEARECLSLGYRDLNAMLRKRYQTRPPIDPISRRDQSFPVH